MHASVLSAIFDVLPDPALVVRAERINGAQIVAFNLAAQKAFPQIAGKPMLASIIRRPEVLDIVEVALLEARSSESFYETGLAQDRRMQAICRPLPRDEGGAALALLLLRDETEALRNERMRADFLANASHELKTPLASLSGFIETLRGHAKDDAVGRERFLGIMAEQADRMARLVADLLSLSRIELDEHILPAGRADLVQCAQDVAVGMQLIAAKANVRIEVSGAKSAPVRGDFHQVVQVIQNLVENAIKYSPPEGVVSIEVVPQLDRGALFGARSEATPGRSLVEPEGAVGMCFSAVRVIDQGKGIAREHLPRLTERFYRAPGQKSGAAFGTGLGLAIVKHIVNRHRGGLFVENLPHRGAAFTAYFPTDDGAARASE